ncbi:hypothetical protein ACK3TF_004953 [Chlorella vulgaris]
MATCIHKSSVFTCAGIFLGGHHPDYLFKCTTAGCDRSCTTMYGNNQGILTGFDFEQHCGAYHADIACRVDHQASQVDAFVAFAGPSAEKKWKRRIRTTATSIGDWIKEQSALLQAGGSLVGKQVSVYRPAEEQYYEGTVEAWNEAAGTHRIRRVPLNSRSRRCFYCDCQLYEVIFLTAIAPWYDDDEAEDLHMAVEMWNDLTPAGTDTLAAAEGMAGLAGGSQRGPSSVRGPLPADSVPGQPREQPALAEGQALGGVGSAADAISPADAEAALAVLTREWLTMQQQATERQAAVVELNTKLQLLLQEADGLVGFRSAASGSSAAVESEVDCAVRLLNASAKVDEDTISVMQAVIDDARALELWFAELKPPALPELRA